MPVEPELDFYLQAYRLHQGLSRHGNEESQQLMRRSMAGTVNSGRRFARVYGLHSFTVLNAWLSNWIDTGGKSRLRAEAIEDIEAVTDKYGLRREPLDELRQRADSDPVDLIARTAVRGYAATAAELDGKDYENVWSLATADLYAGNFDAALAGYERARNLARSSEVPGVSRSSLDVDYADALFFAGTPAGARITEAIDLTEAAIKSNPTDPKRHRWNWTLGWAYYERGGFTKGASDYKKSLAILQKIRNPHHLILKNLIATNAALKNFAAARKLAKQFMNENKGYTTAVEKRWPYRDPDQRERWKRHLELGGLPGTTKKTASTKSAKKSAGKKRKSSRRG